MLRDVVSEFTRARREDTEQSRGQAKEMSRHIKNLEIAAAKSDANILSLLQTREKQEAEEGRHSKNDNIYMHNQEL